MYASARFLAAVDQIKVDHSLRSDRAVSLKAGYNQNYVGQVRNGQHAVSVQALEKLYSEFSVSPLWLLTGKGPMFLGSNSQVLPRPSQPAATPAPMPAGSKLTITVISTVADDPALERLAKELRAFIHKAA